SLVQMPRARRAAVSVPPLRMRESKPADKTREFALALRPDDQMPVIRHHAIGQQARFGPLNGLQQDLFKGFKVRSILKDRQPGVGPVKHMIDVAPLSSSAWSSHRP